MADPVLIDQNTRVPLGWILGGLATVVASAVFIISAISGVGADQETRFNKVQATVTSIDHKVDMVKVKLDNEVEKAEEDRQRIWQALQQKTASRWTLFDEIQAAEINQARNRDKGIEFYIPPPVKD